MAATSSNSWIPTTGRHPVNVGLSLGRALKARKGQPPQKGRLPDRDFYSFRYNFKPESIDSTKPGTVVAKKGKDTTSVTLERASVQAGDGVHMYFGTELPAKEVECVLIYDEEFGTFTLEKLDSYVTLTYDRKVQRPPKQAGSPKLPSIPPTSSSSSTNTSLHSQGPQPTDKAKQKQQARDAVDQLEADLEKDLMEEDAEGEIDDEWNHLLPPEPKQTMATKKTPLETAKAKARANPPSRVPVKQEEEESEGELTEKKPTLSRVQMASQERPKPIPKTSLAAAAAAIRNKTGVASLPPKPITAPVQNSPAPPSQPSQAKPPVKLIIAKKRERPTEAELARNVQPPPKRTKPSPPAIAKSAPVKPPPKAKPVEEKEFSLALPGSESFSLPVSLPPKPVESGISLPGGSEISLPGATVPAPEAADDSDDEWIAVPAGPVAPVTAPAPASAPTLPPIRMITIEEIIPEPTRPEEREDEEEGEEIDENDFEREINQQLGQEDDEDFLAGAISPVVDTHASSGYAGGEVDDIFGEEDEYSSSEEDSDED